MNKDIHFVYGEDWLMLYVDGKLVYDNHNLDGPDLLNILGISCKTTGLTSAFFASHDFDPYGKEIDSLDNMRHLFNEYKEYGDPV